MDDNTLAMKWYRVIFLLVILFTLSRLVPNRPIDPWGLLNLKKFFQLIWALSTIQFLGVVTVRWLGKKHGSILMGFLGGIVSSTALTVTLAKQSASSEQKFPPFILPFLSATLAMLGEAMAFVYIGTEFRVEFTVIFLAPILFTMTLIYFLSKRVSSSSTTLDTEFKIDVLDTLKMVVFIMSILAASKLIQNFMGSSGLLILTFLISLFEIHGNVISNTQLFDSQAVGLSTFGLLLTISIAASYISKICLVSFLGGKRFQKYVIITSGMIIAVSIASWFVFRAMI